MDAKLNGEEVTPGSAARKRAVRAVAAAGKASAPGASHAASTTAPTEDSDNSDDSCLICRFGGELLMCEEKGCGRVYHPVCLGRQPADDEPLSCPLHYCAICGVPDKNNLRGLPGAVLMKCGTCITSFCEAHVPEAWRVQSSADMSAVQPPPAAVLLHAYDPATTPVAPLPTGLPAAALSNAGVVSGEPSAAPTTEGGSVSPTAASGAAAAAAAAGVGTGGGDGKRPAAKRRRTSAGGLTLAATSTPLAGGTLGGDAGSTSPAGGGAGASTGAGAGDASVTAAAEEGSDDEAANVLVETSLGPTVYRPASTFRCRVCKGPTARQQLALMMEHVILYCLNFKFQGCMEQLFSPLKDVVLRSLYLNSGHTHASLNIRRADAAAAGLLDTLDAADATSAAAPSDAVESDAVRVDLEARSAALRALDAAMQVSSAVQLGTALYTAQESALLPHVPTCMGDILANIRSCRYSGVDELRSDLRAWSHMANDIAASYSHAPAMRSDVQLGAAAFSEQMPVQRVREACEEYALAVKNAVTIIDRQVYSRRYSGVFKSFAKRINRESSIGSLVQETLAALTPSLGERYPLPCDAPAGFYQAPPAQAAALLTDRVLEQLGLTEAQALARLHAVRAACLRPSLSWSYQPYRVTSQSLLDVTEFMRGKMYVPKDTAKETLEGVVSRALSDRRKPIITGYGATSDRWSAVPALVPVPVRDAAPPTAARTHKPGAPPSRVYVVDTSDDPSTQHVVAVFSSLSMCVDADKFEPFDTPMARWTLGTIPRMLRARAASRARINMVGGGGGGDDEDDAAGDEHGEVLFSSCVTWARDYLANGELEARGTTRLTLGRMGAASSGVAAVGGGFSLAPGVGLVQPIALAPTAAAAAWMDAFDALSTRSGSGVGAATPTNAGVDMGAPTSSGADAALATASLERLADPKALVQQILTPGAAAAAPGDVSNDTRSVIQLLLAQQARNEMVLGHVARAVTDLSSNMATLAAAQANLQQQVGGKSAPLGAVGATPKAPKSNLIGSYVSYSSIGGAAPPASATASERDSMMMLHSSERAAVAALTEMAPMDVDRDVTSLTDFLPPSEATVTLQLEDLSGCLRRCLVTMAELRAGWAASRRAMFSVPALVPVQHRLVVPDADGAHGVDAESVWMPARDPSTEDATGGREAIITLGEGRMALEMYAANMQLRQRVEHLEALLASRAYNVDIAMAAAHQWAQDDAPLASRAVQGA